MVLGLLWSEITKGIALFSACFGLFVGCLGETSDNSVKAGQTCIIASMYGLLCQVCCPTLSKLVTLLSAIDVVGSYKLCLAEDTLSNLSLLPSTSETLCCVEMPNDRLPKRLACAKQQPLRQSIIRHLNTTQCLGSRGNFAHLVALGLIF